MILKRLFNRIKSQRLFDFKSIVIELALIFTGITLAAKYSEYQNNIQDQKFLKETITQIYSEIKTDSLINYYYWKGQNQRIIEMKEMNKCITEKNEKKLLSDSLKTYFLKLTNTISISNTTLGFTKLINKDVNLIKNEEIKNELLEYYNSMSYNEKDVELFNQNVLEIKPFIFKHFQNYKSYENFDRIIDVQKLIADVEFLNTINYMISDFETSTNTYWVGIKKNNQKILSDLRKEYKFLNKN